MQRKLKYWLKIKLLHFIHSHTNIYRHLNWKLLNLLTERRAFLHKLFQCLNTAINKLLIRLHVDTGLNLVRPAIRLGKALQCHTRGPRHPSRTQALALRGLCTSSPGTECSQKGSSITTWQAAFPNTDIQPVVIKHTGQPAWVTFSEVFTTNSLNSTKVVSVPCHATQNPS